MMVGVERILLYTSPLLMRFDDEVNDWYFGMICQSLVCPVLIYSAADLSLPRDNFNQ